MSDKVEIFVARVSQRRKELMMSDDGLVEILAGILLGICEAEGIDALALVIKAMEECGE